MKLIAHPRMPFCAPEGKVIIEADFSAMELMCGAAYSHDPVMTESFIAPKKLIDANGKEYNNPVSDLHTQSAINCIMPSWFVGVPDSQLVERAKEVPPGEKKSPRDNGKTLNFAEIYLSTAQSLAERNHVSLELAKEWDRRHKETYKGYYAWAAEIGRITKSRGFAVMSSTRQRWCDEANSKGSGESLERNAVNAMIQGSCADCTKQADIECRNEFRGTDVKCLLAVHDALVFEVPGSYTINWDESKRVDSVWTKLKFKVNAEAQQIADRIIQIMEDVETKMFEDLGSPIKGKAEAGISPYWNH